MLRKKGCIDKTFYYAVYRGLSRRIAAILYVTDLGIKHLGLTETVNSASVKPKKDQLVVHNLIGSLYSSIPKLIFSKVARERYSLKNYIPVSCSLPGEKSIFIFIKVQSASSLGS